MVDRTVLILGAGVSRAARPDAPRSARPPLDADFFEIARSISRRNTDAVEQCLRSLVGDYARALMQSLETSTTYLYLKAIDSKPNSTYHLGFLRLLYLLNHVLAQTTNPLRLGPRALLYRFIRSELRKLSDPSRLTIITFNYDLVIERILEELDRRHDGAIFWFPGCYRLDGVSQIVPIDSLERFRGEEYEHDGVAVLKLHGSANWQSVHTTAQPSPAALFRPTRELHVVNSPIISRSLSWRRGTRQMYLKPVIVPPITGKRGMLHERLVGVWEKAATALQQADRVVIAGYSCPPLDLEARILLSENLRVNGNRRVYVIDKNAAVGSRFVELCDVDHITVYNSIENWLRDARP